jgi:hypothetical protein
MTAINRRSLVAPIGIPVTLATADDLDGVADDTQTYDVSGALRVIIFQINDGTGGTAGIDCVEISHDGGKQWYAEGSEAQGTPTGLLMSADDDAGTVLVAGTLNAAGVEPATVEVGFFKFGPFEGPTLIRVGRDTTDRGANGTGVDWITGAPTVLMVAVGQPAGGGAIPAEA